MNCAQCRAVNGPQAGYCSNCGAGLAATPGARPGPAGPAGYWGPPGQAPAGSAPPRPAALPPASWDLGRLSRADKVIAAASLVTMISLWLPWFSWGGSISISGTSAHGWLWLEFLLALVLVGYLAARAAWDPLPVPLPARHETLLIAGTGVQFLLILIGFCAAPYAGSRDIGAILAVIAAAVAAAPVGYPAAKAYLDSRKDAPRAY